MNIEERKREIAILRVLGYTNYETANYIYREIFVLAFLGTVLGLPVGYGMLSYVFSAMDFGSLDQVKWYVWAGTGLISLVAAIIVDAILFFKIKTVNMDDTLKAVE
jgi:putative ABC transport system permease protein